MHPGWELIFSGHRNRLFLCQLRSGVTKQALFPPPHHASCLVLLSRQDVSSFEASILKYQHIDNTDTWKCGSLSFIFTPSPDDKKERKKEKKPGSRSNENNINKNSKDRRRIMYYIYMIGAALVTYNIYNTWSSRDFDSLKLSTLLGFWKRVFFSCRKVSKKMTPVGASATPVTDRRGCWFKST